MIMKKVGDQTIGVIRRRRIDKEGNVSRFQEYHTSDEEEEEPSEHPPYNKYGFMDHLKLQMEDQRNKFTPYPLLPLHKYAVSSLMDTAYRMSKSVSLYFFVYAPECVSFANLHKGLESYQISLLHHQATLRGIPNIEHYLALYKSVQKPWCGYSLMRRGEEKKRFIGGDEVYKFCDETLTDVRYQLANILRLNQVRQRYEYLYDREWSTRDVQRSTSMQKKIEAVLKERRHMRRLDVYVGGRLRTEDIRLFVRPE
ncbi:hypothetical protein Tco_0751248 [Tanacetum coccineum]|uniref:Helitron helicase-like domain-containing protein n=1 Tax=Tanacetum coccineum TaxID=301880 RepID=A0ABQ4Z4B6_9ASTR